MRLNFLKLTVVLFCFGLLTPAWADQSHPLRPSYGNDLHLAQVFLPGPGTGGGDASDSALYHRQCSVCHRVSNSVGEVLIDGGRTAPDLGLIQQRNFGTLERFRYRSDLSELAELRIPINRDNFVSYLNRDTAFIEGYFSNPAEFRFESNCRARGEESARRIFDYIIEAQQSRDDVELDDQARDVPAWADQQETHDNPLEIFIDDRGDSVNLTEIYEAASSRGLGVIIMIDSLEEDLQFYSDAFRQDVQAHSELNQWLSSQYVVVTLHFGGQRTVELNGTSFLEAAFSDEYSPFAPTFITMLNHGAGNGDICSGHNTYVSGYPGPNYFIQIMERVEEVCRQNGSQ